MKPAAQHAAEIIVHYLDLARRGADLDCGDRFTEIESAMQGMIDEARATFRARPDGSVLRLKNPVPRSGHASRPIEMPDAPRRDQGPQG